MTNFASLDLLGTLVAALLTIMVLSYLIGDNPLFRVATHIFVGVAAGYAGTIAWHNVIKPGMVDPLLAVVSGDGSISEWSSGLGLILTLVLWGLGLLLLFKISPATSRLGAIPMAFLVGVGAAVVVGGAITGTLIPQTFAAMDTLNPVAISPQTGEAGLERLINALILLVGTISTLIYFRFTKKPGPTVRGSYFQIMKVIAFIGQIFIAITFGAIYAGVLAASIVVFSERIKFLLDVIPGLLAGM